MKSSQICWVGTMTVAYGLNGKSEVENVAYAVFNINIAYTRTNCILEK